MNHIAMLKDAGVAVERNGDKLRLRTVSGEPLPLRAIELAREHKAELLAELPDTSPTAGQRARLIDAALAVGLPQEMIQALPDAEIEGCELLDDAGLRRWLQIREENIRMLRGIAPAGWTQPSLCRRCGPVKLWAGAPLRVLGCPWCHVRRAGGTVPRPAITCAGCTHQQPQPNTSPAGMHGCAKGHGLHYARTAHPCADWHPVTTTPTGTPR